MKYGLTESVIIKLSGIFLNYKKIEKVLIYGSRAKGNYSNGSDIDLTLVGDSLELIDVACILVEIDDLLLPYTIDLSVFSKIQNIELIEHINRVGEEFWVRQDVTTTGKAQ